MDVTFEEDAVSEHRSTTPGYSPLDMAVEAFRSLNREPWPLELHGLDLGDEFPPTCLRLDEAQSLLLDP